MILLIGLGNPGKEYTLTRHNAGFLFLDAFARSHDASDWKSERKVFGDVLRLTIAEKPIVLLKPSTFMNLSGKAVAAAVSFYKSTPQDLCIIHDDLAFPLGAIRLKKNGSSGGHNGVQSIIDTLGTQEFTRLRIGIAPEIATPIRHEHFVVEKFSKDEKKKLSTVLSQGKEILDKYIQLK